MNITDYMDRPEELAKYAAICAANGFTAPADGARGLCKAIAADDVDLFNAIWSIWNFENAFDDLLDETDIDEERKLLALSMLHNAIVEALDTHDGCVALEKFLEVWKHLVKLTHWRKQRQILAAAARTRFFGMLHLNPFVRGNTQAIKTLLVQAMLRCISGDLMAQSKSERTRTLAAAVRCGDVDLFHHMIYLARGFAAATAWCGKFGYDVEGNQ